MGLETQTEGRTKCLVFKIKAGYGALLGPVLCNVSKSDPESTANSKVTKLA